jgi:hypothetical protein
MIQIDSVYVHTRLTGCHGDLITDSGGLWCMTVHR